MFLIFVVVGQRWKYLWNFPIYSISVATSTSNTCTHPDGWLMLTVPSSPAVPPQVWENEGLHWLSREVQKDERKAWAVSSVAANTAKCYIGKSWLVLKIIIFFFLRIISAAEKRSVVPQDPPLTCSYVVASKGSMSTFDKHIAVACVWYVSLNLTRTCGNNFHGCATFKLWMTQTQLWKTLRKIHKWSCTAVLKLMWVQTQCYSQEDFQLQTHIQKNVPKIGIGCSDTYRMKSRDIHCKCLYIQCNINGTSEMNIQTLICLHSIILLAANNQVHFRTLGPT